MTTVCDLCGENPAEHVVSKKEGKKVLYRKVVCRTCKKRLDKGDLAL